MNAVSNTLNRGRLWLRFLGSMNLAITLLVGVAFASVIGTVLKQNQPYADYLIKFGSFWHEVFGSFGLYDVYSSVWFLLVLTFLVLSTSVCLVRNTPAMLRTMRDFRDNLHWRSLRHLQHKTHWVTTSNPAAVIEMIAGELKRHGYRTRIHHEGDSVHVAAMRGSSNRLGYLFTHVAIVIICLGGLADGNAPLKVNTMLGRLQVETRELPVSRIPPESRLPVQNRSFRASVSIPEGASVTTAFVNLADGYLAQPLPFTVELKDFRVEHYPSGQPKSFESDLRIEAPGLTQPLERTIAVNHPLKFRGYTIYQASFGDGGSKLQMKAWMFTRPLANVTELQGAVNETLSIQTAAGPLRLELTDFRVFNINPAPKDDPSGKKFRNFGPSFTFKLRKADGTAREYVNYMLPVEIQGRSFMLSGMRSTPAEEFRYLHIPLDREGSARRFLRLVRALHEPAQVDAVVPGVIRDTVTPDAHKVTELQSQLDQAIRRLVELYIRGGFDEVVKFVDTAVPAEHRDAAKEAYIKMLQAVLYELYRVVLQEEGVAATDTLTESDERFFRDAVIAASALPLYGSPMYLSLVDFTEIQASGLQITRTPGKNVVYLGFALLIAGVFLLFYVPHQRLWAIATPHGAGGSEVLLAGQRQRHERDFGNEFDTLSRKFTNNLSARRDFPGEPEYKTTL